MNEHDDFEDELRKRMRDTTAPVVAGDELQRRLVTAAAAGQGSASVWTRVFRTTWALPAAAAVVTLLAAGSAVVAVRAAGAPAVTHGTAVGTPNFAPPASGTPTLTPSSAAPIVVPPATPTTHSASHSLKPTPPSTHHSKSSPPSTPRPSSSRSVAPPPFPASCTTPAGGSTVPSTLDGFKARVIGTWLVCSEPSALSTDDAGLLISSDGTWARLVWNPSGKLVYASDLNSRGTWEAIDDSAMNGRPVYQLNLNIPGGGVYIMGTQFAADVNRMHLDNNGTWEADYVPTTLTVSKS